MHKIKWHPSSEMLLNHAMGNTNEAESLIISSHITYCSMCKAEVAKYENIGGFYLKNHEELNVSKSLWNNLLGKLDEVEQDSKEANYVDYKIKSRLNESGVRVPSFLYQYLPNASDTKNWSSTINNVKYFNINFKETSYKGKMLEIPPGKVTSYTTLAKHIGKPKAVRTVATAIGKNPLCWLIPCHRVLRANGDLGGYHWGLNVKKNMLAHESQINKN